MEPAAGTVLVYGLLFARHSLSDGLEGGVR